MYLKNMHLHPLVKLTKLSIENYLRNGQIISPPNDLPKEFLTKKAGVFVTITKNENLRACIGTFLPTKENIAEETIANSIAAATEDWRFGPIEKEELPDLKYEVSILSKPERVKSLSELNPKKYGVIVQSAEDSYKKGLLLPNLEGVDTVEKQISIAAQKGDIDYPEEKIVIYKFTVEKYD